MPPNATPYTMTPAPSPAVFWTVRLTSSASSASWWLWATRPSKAIALSTCGSPMVLATTNARSAGGEADEHPVQEQFADHGVRSVAGEAEEVAGVVHELVHVLAAEQRRWRPGRARRGTAGTAATTPVNRAHGHHSRIGMLIGTASVAGGHDADVCHVVSFGIPRPTRCAVTPPGLTSGPRARHSGATVSGSHRLPDDVAFAGDTVHDRSRPCRHEHAARA